MLPAYTCQRKRSIESVCRQRWYVFESAKDLVSFLEFDKSTLLEEHWDRYHPTIKAACKRKNSGDRT